MVDYRKFASIIDSDEEEEQNSINMPASVQPSSSASIPPALPASMAPPLQQMTKKGKEGRFKYEFQGRTVYEWEQSLTDVNIFVVMPPEITRKMLDISIAPHHLTVGIKGASSYIDEDTGGYVKPHESTWLISDGEIQISLQKMSKAEAWDCALKGRGGEIIDLHSKEEVKKKLMLERFQEEVDNAHIPVLP
jgi:hypothetical protein